VIYICKKNIPHLKEETAVFEEQNIFVLVLTASFNCACAVYMPTPWCT